MNQFYQLNKKELNSFLYLFLFLTFICLISLLYYLLIDFESNAILIISLIALFIIIIFVVDFFEKYYIWSKRKKLLNDLVSIYPYSELQRIGFNNDINLYDSGFKFFGKSKFIDDVQIVFYVFQSTVCTFKIPCDTGNYSWQKFLELKSQNFIINPYDLSVEINYKKEKKSIQEIERMLNEMIILVKKNNFPLLLIDKDGNY